MNFRLNKRLQSAAAFVKKGAVVADIGCDHAYLPIYLVETGIADRVIAADINKGPCEKARENIRKNGLSDKIDVLQTDGLKGLEKYLPDNIVICGMGGDLIFKIVSASEYTRSTSPLLILQPQTRQTALRASLLEHGYNIVDEGLCVDDRLYEIIVAKYDGKKRHWKDIELILGKRNIEKNTALLQELIKKTVIRYQTVLNGKVKAGLDVSKEKKIILELGELQHDSN